MPQHSTSTQQFFFYYFICSGWKRWESWQNIPSYSDIKQDQKTPLNNWPSRLERFLLTMVCLPTLLHKTSCSVACRHVLLCFAHRASLCIQVICTSWVAPWVILKSKSQKKSNHTSGKPYASMQISHQNAVLLLWILDGRPEGHHLLIYPFPQRKCTWQYI